MTPPVIPAVGEIFYRELAQSQPGDEGRSWPMRHLVGAVATAFCHRLFDIVRDSDDGPGWSSLMDPARCPDWALPWLAQFAGVRLANGLTADQQRAQIATPPPFLRGTRQAMIDMVADTLTGTKTVRVLERVGGDAYALTIATRTSETPDAASAEAAARAQKPIGLILTFVVSDEPLIDEGTRAIDAGTATIDAATLADVT